jgi:hypothetical protein
MSLDVLAKKGTYFIIRIRLKNRRSVRCSDDERPTSDIRDREKPLAAFGICSSVILYFDLANHQPHLPLSAFSQMNIFLFILLSSGVAAYHIPNQLAAQSQVGNRNANDLHHLRQQPQIPQSIHDRRTILSNIALATTLIPNSVNAQDNELSSLEKRLVENSLAAPQYGMQATDIFYPAYFQGNWKASSKTIKIYAPCGFDLFPGGQSAYDNTVQKEINGNDVLEYKARFVSSGDDVIIADREYNAKEIAKAAMGSFSVVDVSEATPNRFSCLLAPPEGSGGSLLCVVRNELFILATAQV